MYHSDIRDTVNNSLGRLLADMHPIDYARTAPTWDVKRQKTLWRELAAGGWLDIASPGYMEDTGLGYEGFLAIAEQCGRVLLTLPFGFHAMFASPLTHYLSDIRPPSLSAMLPQDSSASPVAGEVYRIAEDGPLAHFYAQAAGYIQCRIDDLAAGTFALRKINMTSLVPVDPMDPCVGLGHVKDDSALVEATCCIEPEKLRLVLYRYMAFELGEMIGAGACALEMSVVYANERMQFGRRIGEFQSIKHSLADVSIALDNARYALSHFFTLIEQESNTAELNRLGAMASRISQRAATAATKAAIQVHGGIGFSWEHDAHLYLKRVYRLASRTNRLATTLGLP